jgi:hypothetical protein
MGIGVSVFLLAVGAVLRFAIHSSVPHTNLGLVGLILMIAGAVGLLIALVFAASHRGTRTTRERVIERDSHPARGG